VPYAELVMPRRSSDKSCPKCGELWAAYDAASRKYADLIKEQALIAATSPERSWVLDPLIELADKRRTSARAAIEFHRVLDHGKEPRTMTAGS
jgi:hypothetical protein